MHSDNSGGPTRYLATNSTSTAFTIAAGGVYPISALPNRIHPFGNSLGANLWFFGSDASPNNKDFHCRVWYVWPIQSLAGTPDPQVMLQYMGLLVPVISNANTMDGNGTGLSSSDFMADTITWTPSTTATTPKGPASVMETGWSEGTFITYSPADDTLAMFGIPVLGRAQGFMLDFDCNAGGAAITSANALIQVRPA